MIKDAEKHAESDRQKKVPNHICHTLRKLLLFSLCSLRPLWFFYCFVRVFFCVGGWCHLLEWFSSFALWFRCSVTLRTVLYYVRTAILLLLTILPFCVRRKLLKQWTRRSPWSTTRRRRSRNSRTSCLQRKWAEFNQAAPPPPPPNPLVHHALTLSHTSSGSRLTCARALQAKFYDEVRYMIILGLQSLEYILGSIASRWVVTWARPKSREWTKTGPERAAEIEPGCHIIRYLIQGSPSLFVLALFAVVFFVVVVVVVFAVFSYVSGMTWYFSCRRTSWGKRLPKCAKFWRGKTRKHRRRSDSRSVNSNRSRSNCLKWPIIRYRVLKP